MRNISFDNPYLLLIAIPLLLGILIPISIAIRKENKSKATTASLVMHLIIALCVTLAIGGMIYTSIMTRTQVYVVADVSYSANRNLDQVDQYIQQIKKNLPRNSQLGVVVFAEESKILIEPGDELVSVKEHGYKVTQTDATNISGALNYASGLFSEDVIKRIILITDGNETRSDAAGELVAAVENIYANNIYIDAIYLNSNLDDNTKEVQISDVSYAPSTYKNHEAYAQILVQSTYATDNVILDFFVDNIRTQTKAISLSKGYNVIEFPLPTGSTGRFDYRFALQAQEDTTTSNNLFDFTQRVNNEMQILLVSGNPADEAAVRQMYGSEAIIDCYINDPKVPCTVEEMCKYDEIVLSSFDVRTVENFTSFVDAIDKCVSRFGKSLITMGNLKIQGNTDAVLKQLEDMLPVKYGNSDQDPKLYAIVLDTSRSMFNFSRLRIAKQAAIQLLGMLSDNDYVMVVNFYGSIEVAQHVTKASNREDIIKVINDIQPKQGTVIGAAMDKAYEFMDNQPFTNKQIMLISDGMSYSNEKDDPVEIARKLRDKDVYTSVIHPAGTPENGDQAGLKKIAEAGGGKYFAITRESELLGVMFDQISPDMTESVIEGNFTVNFQRPGDAVLDGVTGLPSIKGYAYAKTKASSTTVLTLDYKKSGGTIVQAPLYAYWDYGNGRVSTFTSSLADHWSSGWEGENGSRFFSNIAAESVPEERIDRPYSLNVTFDGTFSHIEVTPVTLRREAVANVTVRYGDKELVAGEKMIFDSTKYYFDFETPSTGRYEIKITYTYADRVFEATSYFNISYSPEYNLFDVFDPATLHAAIRNRGTVNEGTIPNMEHQENEVATYTVRFLAPLMIVACALYVIDIIVRKLKIADIKSFFGIKPKRGAGK